MFRHYAHEIYLSPDEPNHVFYKKLTALSPEGLRSQLDRFARYAELADVVRFQNAAFEHRSYNISITYNEKYGFHTTSCPWSNPALTEEMARVIFCHCNCRRDIQFPDRFFERVRRERFDRCANCGHNINEHYYEDTRETEDPSKPNQTTTT
ncbi:dna polymerase i [Lasius niger]|uniref:Dna polymerase i n=1 Tax=Lasius niger TaxID=67767 RepID=A0A0J7JXU8_LASNI|nr:dna polymerase i [Lasius niger]